MNEKHTKAMKPANVFLFFFLLLSVSCRSDYSRKQQEIRQLMACCTDTDTLADLPRARKGQVPTLTASLPNYAPDGREAK